MLNCRYRDVFVRSSVCWNYLFKNDIYTDDVMFEFKRYIFQLHTISFYTFQGYGRADHSVAVELLKKKYTDYTDITWSNDGY